MKNLINNLRTNHRAGGNELTSYRSFVRILSNGIKDNICVKKWFGGHNIHCD